MASTYTELCTKLEEHYTVLDMVATERETTSDALSTHVRYYIPLTVEEYTFMVDKEQAPLVSTIRDAALQPNQRFVGAVPCLHVHGLHVYWLQPLHGEQRSLLQCGSLRFPKRSTCARGGFYNVSLLQRPHVSYFGF